MRCTSSRVAALSSNGTLSCARGITWHLRVRQCFRAWSSREPALACKMPENGQAARWSPQARTEVCAATASGTSLWQRQANFAPTDEKACRMRPCESIGFTNEGPMEGLHAGGLGRTWSEQECQGQQGILWPPTQIGESEGRASTPGGRMPAGFQTFLS